MAFDAMRDRAAVVSVASVWQPPSVVAGAAFDEAARWQIGWAYLPGGSTPAGGGAGAACYIPTFRPRRGR